MLFSILLLILPCLKLPDTFENTVFLNIVFLQKVDYNDLIEMNRIKDDHEDASDYLLDKLDQILLELEK